MQKVFRVESWSAGPPSAGTQPPSSDQTHGKGGGEGCPTPARGAAERPTAPCTPGVPALEPVSLLWKVSPPPRASPTVGNRIISPPKDNGEVRSLGTCGCDLIRDSLCSGTKTRSCCAWMGPTAGDQSSSLGGLLRQTPGGVGELRWRQAATAQGAFRGLLLAMTRSCKRLRTALPRLFKELGPASTLILNI